MATQLTITKGAVNDVAVTVNETEVSIASQQNIIVEVTPAPRQEINIDKGEIGPQGPQGDAATIAVGTTTTGAAGTNASVVNSGTSSDAVFNFTIPRGNQGAQGDTGPQGPKGDTGDTGAGVATGGTTGQVLVKASNTNYDTAWATITGTLSYQGSWNATTNTPALTSSVGTNGYYYVVSVAGSTNLNGITDWVVGDWAIFNGSIWQKIDNTDAVTSVAGRTGAVVLSTSDISGLGTIATQNLNAVDIEGGTIDNTVIGGITPAAGTFTTLTATGQTSLGGAAGSEGLRITPLASSTTYINARAGVNGGNAQFGLVGTGNTDFIQHTLGTGAFRFLTNGIGVDQFRITHTASAVNYVQVTGSATLTGAPTLSAQGSDFNIPLRLQSKGISAVELGNPAGWAGFTVNTTNNPNRIALNAPATGFIPTFSTAGVDTNAGMAFISKGTGAIDLAAGSSGVNISNGGTVTAITRTNPGSTFYTSQPSCTITAPTTAGGVQAAGTAIMYTDTGTTVAAGGTGYTVGDTLTLVGGTPTSSAATFTVATVSAGVVLTVTPINFAAYSVLPSSPAATTGGTGSGCTLTVQWKLNSVTITNAGGGYVEQPTVSFSGGGGSGAAAYATVGSGTTVKSIGATLDISVDNTSSQAFRFYNSGGTGTAYWSAASGSTSPFLYAQGATNVTGRFTSNGTGSLSFYTSGGSAQQFNISHTASAVNYVQVTGGATGSGPTISAQGSDTNAFLALTSKGTSAIRLQTGGSNQVLINNTTSAVNQIGLTGSTAGNAVAITTQGTDTNIDLALTPKGTGLVRFGTYTAGAPTATGYISIKASDGTTYKVLVGT